MQLSGFKSKFKSACCTIVGTADSNSVDLGLDRVQYEGPINLQVGSPLSILSNSNTLLRHCCTSSESVVES